jgi:hypothetical protein
MRRLLRHLAVVPFAVLAASPAAAQGPARGSVLRLRVHDEQGQPVRDAQVVVGGVRGVGRSDAGGEVFIAAIPPGTRLIELRRQGYAMVRIAAAFAGADTVRRDVAMTVQAVELEGVTATSWGRSQRLRRNGFYDRQRAGLGAYMTADRIEQLRPLHTYELFRYMRGFKVQLTNAGWVVVGTRGAGLSEFCVPRVFLDGMAVTSSDDMGEEMAALNMVSPEAILAIEVYQGAASIPVEYNATGSACGVLLIWTRG